MRSEVRILPNEESVCTDVYTDENVWMNGRGTQVGGSLRICW